MNNNRNNGVIFIYIMVALLFGAISLWLFYSEFRMYFSIGIVCLIFDLILLFIYLNNTKSEKSVYLSNLNRILKTFDSVLAYIDCDLEFDDKEIIKIDSFEGLINCQEELKKPVLYKYDEESAIFIILDKNTVYFSLLKINNSVENEVEKKIKDAIIKKVNNKNKDVDESILDDIERTMIVQTKNKKKYKVSPIKDIEMPKLKGQ